MISRQFKNVRAIMAGASGVINVYCQKLLVTRDGGETRAQWLTSGGHSFSMTFIPDNQALVVWRRNDGVLYRQAENGESVTASTFRRVLNFLGFGL